MPTPIASSTSGTPGARDLLVDDHLLDRSEALPAVLPRPRDAGEPGRGHLALPRRGAPGCPPSTRAPAPRAPRAMRAPSRGTAPAPECRSDPHRHAPWLTGQSVIEDDTAHAPVPVRLRPGPRGRRRARPARPRAHPARTAASTARRPPPTRHDQRRDPRPRRGAAPRAVPRRPDAGPRRRASCSSSTTARRTRPPTSRARAARASWTARRCPTAGAASRGRWSRACTRRPARSSSSSTPTRARCPASCGSSRAVLDEVDFVTAGPRFHCAGYGERLLHPQMAVTIPYRTGPGDALGWQPDAEPRDRQRPVHRDPPRHAARRRRLGARQGEHDRGRRARPRAAARRPHDGVRRRLRPARGAHVRVRARDVARLEPLAHGARRHEAAAPGREPRRHVADDRAPAAAPARSAAARSSTSCCSRSGSRCRPRSRAPTARAARRSGSARSPTCPVVARLTWSAIRPTRSWRGRTYARRARSARRSGT